MTQSVLDSLTLAYEPIWSRERALAAVRLHIGAVRPEAADATHLLQLLGDSWPESAPPLVLAFNSPRLLAQALMGPAVAHTWVEVPSGAFDQEEGLARLSLAAGRGHHLMRRLPLSAWSQVRELSFPVRNLLQINDADAQTLAAAPAPGALYAPWPRGGLLAGVPTRELAHRALDETGAWGLVGWPEDDVLTQHKRRPVTYDLRVIHEVLLALDHEDCSIERLERIVRQDAVLVYRILLLVNSAAYGLRREIGSLRHALMMLGFRELSRWLTDQVPEGDPDEDLHPLRQAMVMRARMAQHLLATGSDDALRAEVYATALLSQLDRLLHQPLPELLHKLPLPGRVFDATLRRDGPYFPLVDMARALATPAQMHQLPALSVRHDIPLEQANRALLRMLTTSRDHAGVRSERFT
ncbi:HDOD domain-containing protein [Hydrogenophaga sp.]|uniref:HDOD domain-containing protein n=1 Tax=Hydrogenophaga sp. TaxID=1904254 RepID=UPI0035B37A10